MSNAWRMESPCANCPFNETGPGRELRDTLRPGRFAGILADLRRGSIFPCHKTTVDGGAKRGQELLCAGAIEWQEENGCTSNYQRVCERLDFWAKERGNDAPETGQGGAK